MEFNFLISEAIDLDIQGFAVFDSNKPNQTSKQNSNKFALIINTMGALSAKAQALKSVITTYDKINISDIRLYLKAQNNRVLGFLKVGHKRLFYRDMIGEIKEINPLCVLDFYVHESCQRGGIGKELFMLMLDSEQTTPERLAYDRPSPKLIGFLKKHFNLTRFIPQNNNFVIFNEYFEKNCSSIKASRGQRCSNIQPRSLQPLRPSNNLDVGNCDTYSTQGNLINRNNNNNFNNAAKKQFPYNNDQNNSILGKGNKSNNNYQSPINQNQDFANVGKNILFTNATQQGQHQQQQQYNYYPNTNMKDQYSTLQDSFLRPNDSRLLLQQQQQRSSHQNLQTFLIQSNTESNHPLALPQLRENYNIFNPIQNKYNNVQFYTKYAAVGEGGLGSGADYNKFQQIKQNYQFNNNNSNHDKNFFCKDNSNNEQSIDNKGKVTDGYPSYSINKVPHLSNYRYSNQMTMQDYNNGPAINGYSPSKYNSFNSYVQLQNQIAQTEKELQMMDQRLIDKAKYNSELNNYRNQSYQHNMNI